VMLRGYIDRVDAARGPDGLVGVVVDYKRSPKTLELDRVYHGLSLQLVAYMLALRDVGASLAGKPIEPVGALYVTLTSTYQKVNHPDRAKDKTGAVKARGLLDRDALDLLEREPEQGWSPVLQVYRKKDGTLGCRNTCDVVEPDQRRAILEYVTRKVAELSDAILDGEVAVAPYRLGTESPCTQCPFKPVCRFEVADMTARRLAPMRRQEALARIAPEQS